MTRYVLCPGDVISRYDGQRHYIGAVQLARLYRVNIRDCRIFRGYPDRIYPGETALHPSFNGDYSLCEKNVRIGR